MKNLLFSLMAVLFSLIFVPVSAQTTTAEPEQVYHMVQEIPQFPGGNQAMMEYLNNNLKYPAIAQQEKLEGMVVLQFVVSKTGNISDITVLKPMGGGLTEEAIRVVKAMPTWTAGRQNGKPVNVFMTLPVRFSL